MGAKIRDRGRAKLDTLPTIIFLLYRCSSLDIKKLVLHKSRHQFDVSHTQKQKIT